MKVLNFNEARARLDTLMDYVCKHHSPAVLTRKNDDSVVMLSLADFNSIRETLYLLGSVKNASRLLESVEQIKAGRVRVKHLPLERSPKQATPAR